MLLNFCQLYSIDSLREYDQPYGSYGRKDPYNIGLVQPTAQDLFSLKDKGRCTTGRAPYKHRSLKCYCQGHSIQPPNSHEGHTGRHVVWPEEYVYCHVCIERGK